MQYHRKSTTDGGESGNPDLDIASAPKLRLIHRERAIGARVMPPADNILEYSYSFGHGDRGRCWQVNIGRCP